MSEMTAADLVQDVRELIGEFGTNVYRDGFPDDPDLTGTSILNRINRNVDKILPTGYCKCLFSLNLTPTNPDANEYGLNNGINEIVHCTINGKPLQRVTILELDKKEGAWGDFSQGYPSEPVYYYTYGDVVGFYPYPDQVYTAVFLADAIPAKLQQKADVPQRLSARYHYLLSLGAAIDISITDVENEAAQRRISYMLAQWKEGEQGLRELVNSRGDDFNDQIQAHDYRSFFRRR